MMKKFIGSSVMFFFVVQLGWTQTTKVIQSLKLKVEKAAIELTNLETNPIDPVSVNATFVWSDNKTQLAVILKASIEDEWHIYDYVPKTQPYIASELRLELPKGITAIGEWVKPLSEPYDDGVYIYHGTPVFVQYCSVANFAKEAIITCGIHYQTCDLYKCYPPETKLKQLNL